MKIDNIKLIKNYINNIHDRNIHDREQILQISNLLLNNRIKYDNKWDMEACEDVFEINSWEKTPNGDDEWIFMLNRFGFTNNLILAYILTENDNYINKWFYYINKWLKENSYLMSDFKLFNFAHRFNRKLYNKFLYKFSKNKNKKYSSIRTLDTSIRCYNIINDITYLEVLDKIDVKKKKKINKKIILQLKYLKNNYIDFYDNSNWGIIQLSYMLYCLVLLKEEKSSLFYWTLNNLKKCIKNQILDDGGHIENAHMYHTEVYLSLASLIFILKEKNLSIDNVIFDNFKKMSEYIYYISTPDNFQIDLGDSDKTELSEIMYISYIILEDKKFLNRIKQPLEPSIVYNFYGSKLDNTINNIYIDESNIKKLFTGSKNFIYKDLSNGNMLFVSNYPRVEGHRHVDNESFILYFANKPFLIDSGRYTYRNNEYRKYFKSQLAHNTIMIDDLEFMDYNDSWKFNNNITNTLIDFKSIKDVHIISTSLTTNKYIVDRKFLIINKDIIVIFNHVKYFDNCEHILKQIFNFDKNVNLKKNDKLCVATNDNEYMYLYNFDSSFKYNKGILSNKYNCLTDNNQLILEKKFSNESITIDFICQNKLNINYDDKSIEINDNIKFKIFSYDEIIYYDFEKNKYNI